MTRGGHLTQPASNQRLLFNKLSKRHSQPAGNLLDKVRTGAATLGYKLFAVFHQTQKFQSQSHVTEIVQRVGT